MSSIVLSSSQHLNITDLDDLRPIDSVQYSLTLSSDESAIVHAAPAIPDPEGIDERMSSVPTPRYNRPRRIELTSDQNGGAPEVAEVHEFVVHEAATTSCNGQFEEVLLLQAVQTRHMARVCCFSL